MHFNNTLMKEIILLKNSNFSEQEEPRKPWHFTLGLHQFP